MSTSLAMLPINTNAQAQIALGEAARELTDAQATNGALDGDTSAIDNLLGIAQASTNGLLAMTPAGDAEISNDLFFRILTSLGDTQIALDAAADVAGFSPAHWDLGGAISDLLNGAVNVAGSVVQNAANQVAKAATPLLTEIIVAAAALVVLVVILKRNGASLGGLL